ncbi:MAG: hypothetical protein ACRD3C_24015 [Vicinamibacterales bacterium]
MLKLSARHALHLTSAGVVTMRPWVSAGFMFLLVAGIAAQAPDITVLSAIPMQQVMEDLGPTFERATGHKLAITFA